MAINSIVLNLLLVSLFFSSCSFLGGSKEKKFRIVTVPEGAEVRVGNSGLPPGVTPYELSSEHLQELRTNGFLSLKISKLGFQEQKIIISNLGIAEITVDLIPLDKDLFHRLVLGTYSGQLNEILRDMLAIQGLFVLGDIANCKTKLEAFVASWPTIGAAYTMLGSIAVREKDYSLAKSYFLKAVHLDPKDSTAEKMLKAIDSGARQ